MEAFYIAGERHSFYQWDVNQKIIVKDDHIKELHFCHENGKHSLVCDVIDGVANVPNILLQSNDKLCVFGYTGEYTKIKEVYIVRPKPQPENYVYTETEIKRYEVLEKRIEELEKQNTPSCALEVDTTLSIAGRAADAKATGEAVRQLSEEIAEIQESIGATKMEWTDVSEVTSGAFINGSQTSPYYVIVSTADYAYAVAVVDHSRKYRVTCSAPVGPRMIAMFRDENGVKVGDVKHPTTEDQIIYYENYEIEVPTNAYDIVVTSYIGSSSSYVSCYPKIEAGKETKMGAAVSYEEQSLSEAEKAQARANIGAAALNNVTLAEREIEHLTRRVIQAEKANDFAWGTFNKAYFVFVHDDTNSFLSTAYNAFHAENTPMSAATVASLIKSTYDGKSAKEWLDLIVADGGEVLMHYNADLKNDSADDLWRTHVVEPKRVLESEGFEVRGLILANNSDAYSAKGEKFCRRYYDYADKVGTSTRYKLGRTLMLSFASLDAFKAHLDTCAQTPGLYAFGFHGLRTDEAWITEASLREIIQYINAKSNAEITTYGAVFDAIGTTVLEKRIEALENGV